jgi:hypothetical protein
MTTLDYVKERIQLHYLGDNVYAFGKKGRWKYDPILDSTPEAASLQAGPEIVKIIRSELRKEISKRI